MHFWISVGEHKCTFASKTSVWISDRRILKVCFESKMSFDYSSKECLKVNFCVKLSLRDVRLKIFLQI